MSQTMYANMAFFPSSIADQLVHTHPEDNNGTSIALFAPLTLDNLNTLNSFADGGTNVYLTSNEGIQALPAWFEGQRPDSTGSTGAAIASLIITVSKPGNILDAFYFYFYAYNQGNWVLDSPALEFGDHVGDWEHTMLRFVNGVPQGMWFSQHASGEAFSYSAVEKYNGGVRPVVYVAKGTHANYAIQGDHDHTIPGLNLPGGPLEDHTDAGVFWDPAINAYTYSYDASTGVFTSSTGEDPTGYLDFTGRWGDNQLPDSAKGQVNVFGERKYEAGPTGPRDKDLGRANVCSGDGTCIVKPILTV
ncbi:Vacuolar protein sorting-associated protein 62 [Cladophialophora chaetospira]|uniref:Vacuolar protein sorting-associated protein 62 n=1 Tax=Cladophialophora chaetospira TaxID=386627 RepID=A0AA39CIA6_9EURO|nr:Vacuolar protein sorting-associated protein 62 [Cladophialophora chaetospira]